MNRSISKKLNKLASHLIKEKKVPSHANKRQVYQRLKTEYKKGNLKLYKS